MVVSLVLGFLAMAVATMGMKCTNCGGDDKVKKARIATTGGIIFIFAGEQQVQGGPKGSPISYPGGLTVGKVAWGLTISESYSISRSCCLGSLLLVRPQDCLRLL